MESGRCYLGTWLRCWWGTSRRGAMTELPAKPSPALGRNFFTVSFMRFACKLLSTTMRIPLVFHLLNFVKKPWRKVIPKLSYAEPIKKRRFFCTKNKTIVTSFSFEQIKQCLKTFSKSQNQTREVRTISEKNWVSGIFENATFGKIIGESHSHNSHFSRKFQ